MYVSVTVATAAVVSTESPAVASTEQAVAASTESPAAAFTGTVTSTCSDLFNDVEWNVELEGVEVQEIDGTWRDVIIFRNIVDVTHVCIWFGNNEYEGIDRNKPYRYDTHSEVLEDDEGYDINWRMKSDDNDEDDDDYV